LVTQSCSASRSTVPSASPNSLSAMVPLTPQHVHQLAELLALALPPALA
jgi:hypothetical protein